LILSHHSRYQVTCECNDEDINDDDDDLPTGGVRGSETGSYLRLIDFVYHSTLGLRVIQKKKVSDLRAMNPKQYTLNPDPKPGGGGLPRLIAQSANERGGTCYGPRVNFLVRGRAGEKR